jgi:hypothetical protein
MTTTDHPPVKRRKISEKNLGGNTVHKRIVVSMGGFIRIEDFSDLVDTNRVVYYKIKVNKDKTLTVRFYDDKKKLVKPYGK